MSGPMTAARFLKALKDEGLKVVEHPGWATHNRNSQGPWGPVHGVLMHHTVTRGTATTVAICRNGYKGLPGPLCHGVIAKDGTVHLIGYGRANHAGLGDRDVFNAVKAESYATRPPAPDANTMDGNRHWYGFECENLGDGKDPWPAVQVEAMARAGTAICRVHGWTAKSVFGHKEWQKGKVDPLGLPGDMPALRSRSAVLLKGKPGAPMPAPKPPAPAPKPPAPKPPTATKPPKTIEQRMTELEKRVGALEKKG